MNRCTACGNTSPKPLVEGHAWWCPYVTDVLWSVFQYDINGTGRLVWQTAAPVDRLVEDRSSRHTPELDC